MPVNLLMNNWEFAIGLLAVGSLAYWWFDEREDSDSAAETIERVGSRAETVTGGIVGGFGSLLVVFASIGLTIGGQLAETGMMLNELLGGIPVIVGHMLFGLLTFAGLSGAIPLSVQQLGFAFVFITTIAVIARYSNAEAA